jgi:hypothetical protein
MYLKLDADFNAARNIAKKINPIYMRACKMDAHDFSRERRSRELLYGALNSAKVEKKITS